jgi:aryl-alcohol dehydrogenase-like predicted oxidoreductase/ferredoxin
MRYNALGNTGLVVSELCLGVLAMGPLQKNLSLEEGVRLIVTAFEHGVNFLDTAESYGTYDYIRVALREYGRGDIIISSKSTATTYADMEKAIQEALVELDLERIGVFHLHAARDGVEVFEKRAGALECLLNYKEKGLIGSIGISTHSLQVTALSAEQPEIDAVFPLLNYAGFGIVDGGVGEMVAAIGKAAARGKGVFLMKTLAGGNLLADYYQAIDFARSVPGVNSIAIGACTPAEVLHNVRYFSGATPSELPSIVFGQKKVRIMKRFCIGDGACVSACPNDAISVIEGKANVNPERCLLCGYCTKACPEFAIRVF